MDDTKTVNVKETNKAAELDRDYLKEKMLERAETEVPSPKARDKKSEVDASLKDALDEVKRVTEKLEERLETVHNGKPVPAKK